jgi:hypothetical protein
MKTAWRASLLGAAMLTVAAGYLVAAMAATAALSAAVRDGASGAIARSAGAPAIILAQADEEIPPDQIDKYVAVYKAMQRDHSLSVEQAAAAQGLTLQAFRELEERIERNDVARDDARRALAASAQQPTPLAHHSPSRPQP